jgi:amino acid transporter
MSSDRRPPKALGLGPLVAVMFFIVSGGPFGLEGLVGTVGPGLALVLLIVTPLIFSLPETLLIGELASMLPVEGGYYQWVKRAFGRFWGFWNGWLSWTYSLLDMAIYPVLMIQYLKFFVPGLGALESWILACTMIWVATWLNLRGARAVGTASTWFALLVLTPFAVLIAVALAQWIGPGLTGGPSTGGPSTGGPSTLGTPFHAAGTSFLGALGLGLSQSIWNYSGWDNASTIGGEIEDASTNYPRALARLLPIVVLVYVGSVVPVLAVTNWERWTDGAWPELATTVAGPWLGTWIGAAGMVSAFALFNALLLSYSRIPLVLAQDELLPKPLAHVDERGVPRNAVITSAVLYCVCALLPFGGLMTGGVLLYTLALSMEFASLIALRRKEPQLRGPFRVPLGIPGLVVLAAMPLLLMFTAVVLALGSREIGVPGIITAVALALAGPLWFYAGNRTHSSNPSSPK